MNGYNFTDRVRRVLQRAREEAARLGHDYVGSEHVLLGLLAEEKGQAATVLRRHKVDPADLKKRVEAELRPGRPGTAAGSDFPYTSGAKKVLESAMVAARELSHRYVGTEHLLLGLLYDEKGIPARLLGAARPFGVGQLVWDMILLLSGLLVPAAIDRYSLDWRLSRRPRLR